jgi:hypothetical protein
VTALPEITNVQRLILKPGDRVVVRVPGRLTGQSAAMLMERLRAWLPEGVQAMILDDGASLEVLEPPEGQEITR